MNPTPDKLEVKQQQNIEHNLKAWVAVVRYLILTSAECMVRSFFLFRLAVRRDCESLSELRGLLPLE